MAWLCMVLIQDLEHEVMVKTGSVKIKDDADANIRMSGHPRCRKNRISIFIKNQRLLPIYRDGSGVEGNKIKGAFGS